MSSIIEKLEAINARFEDLGVALTNPEIVTDNTKFSQVSKEYRKLEKIVEVYKIYRNCLDSTDFAKEVLVLIGACTREVSKLVIRAY